jgi:uncharacterized damage-inducible protein DinB
METSDFILDTLQQEQNAMMEAVNGLSHEELTWRPGNEANSIGFILWHQIRCEDSMVQGMIQQKPQLWVSDGWHQRLGVTENPQDDGWGFTAEQVAAFPVPAIKDLLGYAEAIRTQTIKYLKATTAEKMDETIQTPMGEYSVGQTIALLLSEIIQHTGQIAYLRGLQRGLDK